MANNARKRYERLLEKRNKLKERSDKLRGDISELNEQIDYAEYLVWKEEKKKGKTIKIDEVGADAITADKIIEQALTNIE